MPPDEPKVSIGLAVYNGERYLPNAIATLLAQEYDNFELLISDNASSDATAHICDDFSRADSRVKYHRNQTNIGAARNFNQVFERSSGKYFMWAAHDDEWSPTFVKRCVTALEENEEVVLCGTTINFIDEDGASVKYPREFNKLDTFGMDLRQRAKALTTRLDWFAIYGLIRQSTLLETRLLTDEYGSDVILLMELLLRGQTLILPERLFHYRFIQKTAEKHLEDISGAVRKGAFKPYTELAQGLLQVIDASVHTVEIKRALRDDLLDNVCQYNLGWSHNVSNENPSLLQAPPYLRPLEIRKLLAPSQAQPGASDGAGNDAPHDITLTASQNVPPRGKFGFNVIGYVSGNLGLGVSTRNIIAALLARGFPVATMDLNPGEGRAGFDMRYGHLGVSTALDLPYDVNLLVFPPQSIGAFVAATPDIFARSDRMNAACTFWELSVLPETWQRTLESFDVIVAFSEFIRHTLEFKLSGPSILSARHPLYLPDGVSAQRKRFGIDEGDIAFVTSLELGSDPFRKNAHAVIEAFLQGLSDAPNARLLVKVNNAFPGTPYAPYLAFLENAAASDTRIRVINRGNELSGCSFALHERRRLCFASSRRRSRFWPFGGDGARQASNRNRVVGQYDVHESHEFVSRPIQTHSGRWVRQRLFSTEFGWTERCMGRAQRGRGRNLDATARGSSMLRAEIGRKAAASIAQFREVASEVRFADEIQSLWKYRDHGAIAPERNNGLAPLRDPDSSAQPKTEGAIVRFRRRIGQYLDTRGKIS